MTKVPIKTAPQIEGIRRASQITAKILDEVGEIIKPGVSTAAINDFVHKMTLAHNSTPAPLNYKGFPGSVCTSINDVVCHGVPSPYVVLQEGDIVNVDVTSIHEGFFGDASRMYFVGGREAASEAAQVLVEVTLGALNAGLAAVRPGAHFGNIGAAIQKFIKQQPHKYGIVREYTGHGIGTAFHEPPQIVHVGRRGTGPVMEPGMIFTVEPMINLGTPGTVLSKVDGWTVRTADGELSAQWEHTVLVTDDGCERLTQSLNGQDY